MSTLPLGDVVKVGRIGKDVRIIGDAIGITTHRHHIIPKAVYRDNADVLTGVLRRDSVENLLELPAGFHGNHPAYSNWIQRQIVDMTKGGRELSAEELSRIMSNAKAEIEKARISVSIGSSKNLNDYFKKLQ